MYAHATWAVAVGGAVYEYVGCVAVGGAVAEYVGCVAE